MVSVERLLLFLMSEGRPENAPKSMREATKTALRDLQTMEQDASFKSQKVQFLLDSTLGRINLLQNDIIKLFSVIAVIFMLPTVSFLITLSARADSPKRRRVREGH